MWIQYIICLLIGYTLGMSNMAWYIAKVKKVNLRTVGSGNLGASNVTMAFGKRAGILTFLHDAIKVMAAVYIVKFIFPEAQYAAVVAAVAGVLGHMYPVYLKFRGGKGFASYIGLALALKWKYGLCMFLCVIAVSLIFDWVVAGTFFHIALTPLHFCFSDSLTSAVIVMVASVCIFVKHTENIKRMRLGQESKLRSVLFKKKEKEPSP